MMIMRPRKQASHRDVLELTLIARKCNKFLVFDLRGGISNDAKELCYNHIINIIHIREYDNHKKYIVANEVINKF